MSSPITVRRLAEGDLGAIDEVKSFHHEGDGEENLSSLNDLKQDLEQEADTDKAKVKNFDRRLTTRQTSYLCVFSGAWHRP